MITGPRETRHISLTSVGQTEQCVSMRTATTAACRVRLLSLPDADPFEPLRHKLGWRGSVL